MKKTAFLKIPLFLAVIVFLNLSCAKRKEIVYPEEMEYGKNVLSPATTLQSGTKFSAGAKLGKKATLKIVLTNLTPLPSTGNDFPAWSDGRAQGWIISEYKNRQQTYTANKEGTVISMFMLLSNTGSFQLDFFENSSDVTKSVLMTW